MANVASINGNPIVVGMSGLEDGSVPDSKLVQTGGVLSEVHAHSNVLMVPTIEARSRQSSSNKTGLWIHPVDFNGHDLIVRISDKIVLPDGYFFLLTVDWYTKDTGTLNLLEVDKKLTLLSASHEVVIPRNPVSNVDGLYAAVGFSLFMTNNSSQDISLQTTGYETFVTISPYDGLRGEALESVADAYASDGELGILALSPFANTNLSDGRFTEYNPKSRAVSMLPIRLSDSVTLSVDDGYRFGIHTYNSDGSFSTDFGWQTGRFTIPADTPFRIIIARSASTEIATSYFAWKELVPHVHAVIDDDTTSTASNRKMWVTSAHRGYVPSGSGLHENTLASFYEAAKNDAEMIETDARLSSDGVLVANHDPTVTGTNALGETVTYTIAETDAATLQTVILSEDSTYGTQYVPTLEQVLNLAYNTGMDVNIDLKNGYVAAEQTARMVLNTGMRGHVVYALNGSGLQSVQDILRLDPKARFIDVLANFSTAMMEAVDDYESRFYAYTSDLTSSTIEAIRESSCMLALISLDSSNFATAIAYHPEMCEFPHTSDFRTIEDNYFENLTLC